jgi:phage terminase large subunit-like protein
VIWTIDSPAQNAAAAACGGSEGVPMQEFWAPTQKLQPTIIEMHAAMRDGRLRHDGNPVLEWCMGNVVDKADRRGNLYPTKTRPDQKRTRPSRS